MKIEGNTNIKVYIKVLLNSLIFLFIAALFAQSANAALQAVGPNDQFGFAAWYSDANGLALEPCLGNVTNFDDVYCVLGAGEDPTLPLALTADPATTNFPDEFFYWIVEAGPIDAGPNAIKVRFRMVLEGAFATPISLTCPLGGCPALNQQITFLRINLQPAITGLVPNATYILTYPFGQVPLTADATGTLGRFRLEDSSFIIGDFASVLPGTLTRIGPFLTQLNMPPGGFTGPLVSANNPTGRYISQDSINFFQITPGPNGDFFRITGPNIGGAGVNTLLTNQWTIAGRFFPGAGDINGSKINDDNANGVQDAGEATLGGWNITLRGLDTGVVKNTTTNATGFYEFAQMLPGNYTITEELKPGWANTTPISRTFRLLNGGFQRENFTNLFVRHGVTISVVGLTAKTTTLGVPATYTIMVNNTGNLQDTFTLTTTASANAVVTLSQPSITIPALGSAPVTLGVTSNTAVSPPPFTVSVTATSEGDRTVTATTVPGTTTEVLGIIVTPRIAMLKPGESMTFTASETVNITFSATSGIIVPGAVPGTAVFTAGATGEVTISATNTTITPTPVGATGTATVFVGANRSTSQALVTGYNQVILPVQPPAVTFTASKLLQLVKAQTTAQGLNVDALKVVRWNDAAQKFEAFDPAAGVAGTDFAIEGGKVYFIRMSGPGAVVSIVGTITGIS